MHFPLSQGEHIGGSTAENSSMGNTVAGPSSIMVIKREETCLVLSAAAQRRNEGQRPGKRGQM